MKKAYLEITKCSGCPYYTLKREVRPVLNHTQLVDVHYCVDREMGETNREEESLFESTIHKDCFIYNNEGNVYKI